MGLIGLLLKIVVFTVNVALWVSGILLLVFGAIAVGNPPSIIAILNIIPGVSNVTALIDVYPLFEGVAIFMIVLGSILFLFGFVGCHGAWRMHKHSLFSYSLLLIVGVGTEIALIIYAALFPNTTTSYITTQLQDSLNTSFVPATIDSTGVILYSKTSTGYAWEILQAQSDCCGGASYKDYYTSESWLAVANGSILPPTCCNTTVGLGVIPSDSSQFKNLASCQAAISNFYSQGCAVNVQNMVYQFDLIAIIISACLLGAQLIGLIFTCHSWHKMYKEEGFA